MPVSMPLLRDYAEARGVGRTEGKVVAVALGTDSGFASGSTLEDGPHHRRRFVHRLFGVSGLLIEEALQAGYEDWISMAPLRPGDRGSVRVTGATPFTRSTALAAGWQWRIPLQHRTGNGYVYAS